MITWEKKNVLINWPQGTPESPVQATPDMITWLTDLKGNMAKDAVWVDRQAVSGCGGLGGSGGHVQALASLFWRGQVSSHPQPKVL